MSSHCAYHCLAGASSVSLRLMAQDQSDAFYYLHSLGALHSFSFRQPETNMAAHQPVVIDLDEDIVIARPGTPARYQNEQLVVSMAFFAVVVCALFSLLLLLLKQNM